MSGDDGRKEPSGWRSLVGLNGIGLLLMVATVVTSLVHVLSIRHETHQPGLKVIRIAHWQLESGYREAMQAVIDDYNALHAADGIKVIQEGVTERVYTQWLNVNLIAGSAPDIAEMGRGLSDANEGVAKYFVPLGQDIVKPNPYNAEIHLDDLENRDERVIRHLTTAPWRETMVDGMRGGYKQDLQDYYSIPTSFFTIRMFYNRALLAEATGDPQAPRTLATLLDACQKLRAWAKQRHQTFDPIAGTRYHRDIFVNTYRVAFTYKYLPLVDTDLSGDLDSLECWGAFQSATVSLNDPAFTAYYDVVRTICGLFNKQFAAMDRDQAIAAFAQGRAAFMASGSWDAASIFGACRFDVGVMEFPMPAPGEPYGEYGQYGANEAGVSGGGGFGITKTSQHQEEALDFLRFISSHKWNQKLNRLAGWLPVTLGTAPSERMKPFMPNPYGVSSAMGFFDGFDAGTLIDQALGLFLGGEIDYAGFRSRFDAALNDPQVGYDRIWFKQHERQLDSVRGLERTIAVQSARALMGTGSDTTERRVRETVLDQTLVNNGANIRLLHERQNRRPFPKAP